MSDSVGPLEIRFTPIGAEAPHRPALRPPRPGHRRTDRGTTTSGAGASLYTGPDERERELEIIALDVQPPDGGQACLLVIHVMPTRLRGEAP